MKASKKVITEATQLFRACFTEGVLDEPRVRKVVRELGDKKPRGYLATLAVFRRLVQIECARHTAKIESAQPLSEDLKANVLKTLTAVYGTGLDTTFSQNHQLIGGLRIQVGSDVYDGTVRGRLARLEQSF